MSMNNEINRIKQNRPKQILTMLLSFVLILSFVTTPVLTSPKNALANDLDDTSISSDEAQPQSKSSITGLEDVSADWANFRNSDYNMAITNADTPTSSSNANLLWAKKLTGTSMWVQPNTPIIVDNCLITTASTTIYKIDLATGDTVLSASMVRATDWGYTPMTYAEGMIFVPIKGGVQAFNAKTLESLWVYTYDASAQSLSPITYSDGCIYTGWWHSETRNADYACIDIKDDDTNSSTEAKTALWIKSVAGGLYWAGSFVVGDCVVFGTDNATSDNTGTAHVYSLNKKTGSVVSDIEIASMGDIRSSMAYDSANNRIYFTTKGAYVCRLDINSQTGSLSNLTTKKLVDSSGTTLSSTSTPVVYGSRVFVGAGNPALGGSGNKSDAFFILNADTLNTIDSIELEGECKSSPLLSTAHINEGYLYFYITYNKTPGGIEVVKVPASDQSRELAEIETLYDASGYEQYCICSPICANDGTIYYRNDSGYMFAIGTIAKAPAITTDLNATQDAFVNESSTLSIEAEAQDSSSITYQWYSSTDNANFSAIDGATSSSYTYVPTQTGSTWFYCVATATKGTGQNKTTAQTTSSICEVTTDAYVDVEFTNSTYATSAGAIWTGTKNARVSLSDLNSGENTAKDFISKAASLAGITNCECTNSAVVSVGNIKTGDKGASSKWAVLINDWQTTEGINQYSLGDGVLESGSKICVSYTVDGGSDIGVLNGTNKLLSSLEIEGSTLSPAFDKDTKSYTAVIDSNTLVSKVKATPADKAFMIKLAAQEQASSTSNTTYSNGTSIPMFDGQTISVTCGDPSWPTTSQSGQSTPAQTYTINIKTASPSLKLLGVEFASVNTGKIHASEVETKQITIENTGNTQISNLSISKDISDAFEVANLKVTTLLPGEKTTLDISTKQDTPANKNLNTAEAIPYTGSVTISGADSYGNAVSQTSDFWVAVGGIDWSRLSGGTRYETSAAIVEEGFSATGKTVIVASGENFPDALCASGLAGALDEDGSGIPLILTDCTQLRDSAKTELNRLKPSKVIIIGGEAAISNDVQIQIKNLLGCSIDRIAGTNRLDTSRKIYEYGKTNGTWTDTAIVVSGDNFPDALSMSPYAYASKSPIFLASGGNIPSETSEIIKGSQFCNVLIAGGSAVVSKDAESSSQIGDNKKLTRLYGDNRDDTSICIAKWATGSLDSGEVSPSVTLNYNNMALACAGNFPDALAGAFLCGKNKSVVVLINNSEYGANKTATQLMSPNKAFINTTYVLGGDFVIGDNTLQTLKDLL